MTWSMCLRLPHSKCGGRHSVCARRRGTTVLWHKIFIKKLDELPVRGKESKPRDLDTPDISCSLRVKDIYPSCFKSWALTNFLLLFTAVLKHGLMFEGTVPFPNLCYIGKKSFSSDFTLLMFLLALLMLIKRPEAVEMLFLKVNSILSHHVFSGSLALQPQVTVQR